MFKKYDVCNVVVSFQALEIASAYDKKQKSKT